MDKFELFLYNVNILILPHPHFYTRDEDAKKSTPSAALELSQFSLQNIEQNVAYQMLIAGFGWP